METADKRTKEHVGVCVYAHVGVGVVVGVNGGVGGSACFVAGARQKNNLIYIAVLHLSDCVCILCQLGRIRLSLTLDKGGHFLKVTGGKINKGTIRHNYSSEAFLGNELSDSGGDSACGGLETIRQQIQLDRSFPLGVLHKLRHRQGVVLKGQEGFPSLVGGLLPLLLLLLPLLSLQIGLLGQLPLALPLFTFGRFLCVHLLLPTIILQYSTFHPLCFLGSSLALFARQVPLRASAVVGILVVVVIVR